MVGGSEGVGNLVGEPGGLKGGADLVLGLESLNQVLIVVVNLPEQGGAFVTSKDVRMPSKWRISLLLGKYLPRGKSLARALRADWSRS